jgi:hypothetical protein
VDLCFRFLLHYRRTIPPMLLCCSSVWGVSRCVAQFFPNHRNPASICGRGRLLSRMLDLHTPNLAFTILSTHSVSEECFFQKLGNLKIGLLRRNDGKALEPGIPKYLIRPTSSPADPSTSFHPNETVEFANLFWAMIFLTFFIHRFLLEHLRLFWREVSLSRVIVEYGLHGKFRS